MVTGADAEQDVVRGLNAGANDYMAKPFSVSEPLALVRAQLRVFDNSAAAVFLIRPDMFRPSMRLLQDPTRNRKLRLVEEPGILHALLDAVAQVARISATPLLDRRRRAECRPAGWSSTTLAA